MRQRTKILSSYKACLFCAVSLQAQTLLRNLSHYSLCAQDAIQHIQSKWSSSGEKIPCKHFICFKTGLSCKSNRSLEAKVYVLREE